MAGKVTEFSCLKSEMVDTGNIAHNTTISLILTMKPFIALLALTLLGMASANDNQKFIYYTSDDGINGGSPAIMDAAKEAGVKVTFFINGDSINAGQWGSSGAADNIRYFLRMIREGHTIGDHSLNHMAHNSETEPADGRNVYQSLDDIKYFGKSNVAVFAKVLQSVGLPFAQSRSIITDMSKMVRMPFVNNWRVKMANGQPPIDFTCRNCIVPYESAEIAADVADALFKGGKQVFGWDLEWRSVYGEGLIQTPEEMMEEVRKISQGVKKAKGGPNKIVLLNHDHGFLYGDEPKKSLSRFFDMAKKEGYQFRSLSTFATD
ncbi:hypothetical protein TCAL_15140 [Tigriopus californicus]|uniref:NodB homology domain-containing protein n=2 Tax=Tigriopus californicus TaxID=6832 RepID=A0A553NTL7_TIGCA|nr:hypothetical protein TCAL_15140 [Tigriopus californicus]